MLFMRGVDSRRAVGDRRVGADGQRVLPTHLVETGANRYRWTWPYFRGISAGCPKRTRPRRASTMSGPGWVPRRAAPCQAPARLVGTAALASPPVPSPATAG